MGLIRQPQRIDHVLCRYCGSAYARGEVRCQGCGAPKTSIGQQVLDVTAEPDSFSAAFRRSIYRALLLHGGVVGLAMITGDGEGGTSGLPALALVIWLLFVAPGMLFAASWRSRQHSVAAVVINLVIAAGVWLMFVVTAVVTLICCS